MAASRVVSNLKCRRKIPRLVKSRKTVEQNRLRASWEIPGNLVRPSPKKSQQRVLRRHDRSLPKKKKYHFEYLMPNIFVTENQSSLLTHLKAHELQMFASP